MDLRDWLYLFTYNRSLDIYGKGVQRVAIDLASGDPLFLFRGKARVYVPKVKPYTHKVIHSDSLEVT